MCRTWANAMLHGPDHATTAAALETLTSPAISSPWSPGQQSYTQFTNETGGILDDLMVTRPAGEGSDGSLFLVVNAACKDADFARLEAGMPSGVSVEILHDKALLALQGPGAHDVMSGWDPRLPRCRFMQAKPCNRRAGVPCFTLRLYRRRWL